MVRLQSRAAEGGVDLSIDMEAADDLGELSAAGEVAAYHIVLEALTNVSSHAKAASCTVRCGARKVCGSR
jgi:signal transduction histidine kinase